MTYPATGRARRPWTQRLLISFNIFIVIAALVCAAGLGYFNMKLSNIKRVSVGSVLTSSDSGPHGTQNYLLIGADSDQGLASNDPAVQGRGQVTGMRSDTMMVLRVDPNSSKAQLLSVPRDLLATIPGTGREEKINAAISIGGPKLAIETVEKALHIPINHYLEVDFAGFKSLVAAVGGIPIYFNVPVRDAEFCPTYQPGCVDGLLRHSILDIENPGCHVLNPDEALAYARTRYLQYKQNGEWQSDGSGDLGRIKRQQDFMRKALKRALSKGLHNPLKLNSLIDAGLGAVQFDETLNVGDVFTLARKFRSFDPSNLQTIELPTIGAGDNSSLLLDPNAAGPVLAMFRGQAPSTAVNPADVHVQVLNGSGQPGQAGRISDSLAAVGFRMSTAADAPGGASGDTVIKYAPGQEAQAQAVASYLNGPVTYRPDPAASSSSIVVITSSSLEGVRSSANGKVAKPPPPPATTAPAPTATTTPSANNGATSNGSGATTTATTTEGFLPDQPPPGVTCG